MADENALLVVIETHAPDDPAPILRRLHATLPAADVLVLTDGPCASSDTVHVLSATEPAAGLEWAVRHGYQVVVELAADGSHAPEDVPRLLDAVQDADVVIGSRYVPGGHTVNRPRHGRLLARAANFYATVALGVPVTDVTSGFRAYHRRVLQALPLTGLATPAWRIELVRRAAHTGHTVVEVPVTITAQDPGPGVATIRDTFVTVTRWGIRRRVEQLRTLFRPRTRPRVNSDTAR